MDLFKNLMLERLSLAILVSGLKQLVELMLWVGSFLRVASIWESGMSLIWGSVAIRITSFSCWSAAQGQANSLGATGEEWTLNCSGLHLNMIPRAHPVKAFSCQHLASVAIFNIVPGITDLFSGLRDLDRICICELLWPVVKIGGAGNEGLWCDGGWGVGGAESICQRKKTTPNHWALPTRRGRKGSSVFQVQGNASIVYGGENVMIRNWYESWWQLFTKCHN